MDRVAVAAGVAKGTLYLYFPSKDALYLGILNDGLDTAYRTYQGSADPKLPVVERLRRSIEVAIEFFDQRRDFLQFYRDRRAAAGRGAQPHHPGLARARLHFFRIANRRGNPHRGLHAHRSASRNACDPGRDSLLLLYYGRRAGRSRKSAASSATCSSRIAAAQIRRRPSGRCIRSDSNLPSPDHSAGDPGGLWLPDFIVRTTSSCGRPRSFHDPRGRDGRGARGQHHQPHRRDASPI